MVGDIAEALAFDHFELVPPPKRNNGVDALTTGGNTVQLKATGLKAAGPAFSPGRGIAKYLLFFKLDFEAGVATVIYNGPEAPVRERLLPKTWAGTKSVRLAALSALAQELGDKDILPIKERA